MAIVYRHIRLDKNEPFYIGIGDNIKRAYYFYKRSDHWHNIFKKTKIEVEILFDDVSLDFALSKEKELIKLYGRKDLGLGPLVNKTDGGEYVEGLSIETKRIMSDKAKRRIFTDEWKNNMSKSQKGRKHSDTTKEKMKNSQKQNKPILLIDFFSNEIINEFISINELIEKTYSLNQYTDIKKYQYVRTQIRRIANKSPRKKGNCIYYDKSYKGHTFKFVNE
jgi:hypothetical protein